MVSFAGRGKPTTLCARIKGAIDRIDERNTVEYNRSTAMYYQVWDIVQFQMKMRISMEASRVFQAKNRDEETVKQIYRQCDRVLEEAMNPPDDMPQIKHSLQPK